MGESYVDILTPPPFGDEDMDRLVDVTEADYLLLYATKRTDECRCPKDSNFCCQWHWSGGYSATSDPTVFCDPLDTAMTKLFHGIMDAGIEIAAYPPDVRLGMRQVARKFRKDIVQRALVALAKRFELRMAVVVWINFSEDLGMAEVAARHWGINDTVLMAAGAVAQIGVDKATRLKASLLADAVRFYDEDAPRSYDQPNPLPGRFYGPKPSSN